MEIMMSEKTYVYDGQEVRKTGRVARKKFRAAGRPLLQGTRKPDQIQIEIEALPDPNTDTTPWKKWVREEELFQIDEEPDLLTEE
jgi:hypothetical protein